MKNKVFKSIVAILLSAAMLMSFAACGESEKTEGNGNSSQSDLSNEKDAKAEESEAAAKIGNVSVGEYIVFGKYEQDNDTSNGDEPLSWIVLDVQGNKALIITSSIIDSIPYNDENAQITWENCSLRKWLNGDFYTNAFSVGEKKTILKTTVKAEPNITYGTDAGNDTQDSIFLLSENEANTYFDSDSARRAYGTLYAQENDLSVGKYANFPGTSRWWLRSPGRHLSKATYVEYTGAVETNIYGMEVYRDFIGVRPAMWVTLG